MTSDKFKYNLEALRGMVAMLVVFTHCTGFAKVLNGEDPRHGVWLYAFPGGLSVMIFFMLSGYVIGLTTKRFSSDNVGAYLKKRFVRIYPIYFACIVIGFLISARYYSAKDIVSNLLFFQRVTADPMYEVGVNWSLNYEVLFYLLFIPIALFRLNYIAVFLGSLLCGILFSLWTPVPLLAAYGFGFCFWVAGLWLSKTNVVYENYSSYRMLTALVLLILSTNNINFFSEFMHYTLHLDGAYKANATDVTFSALSYLPLAVLVITRFADCKVRFEWLLWILVISNPVLFIILGLKHGGSIAYVLGQNAISYGFFSVSLVFLAVEFVTPKQERRVTMPKLLVNLGGISYGLYLIHFIFIILIGRMNFLPSGYEGLVLRSALVVAAAICASILLEKKMQPFIVKYIK